MTLLVPYLLVQLGRHLLGAQLAFDFVLAAGSDWPLESFRLGTRAVYSALFSHSSARWISWCSCSFEALTSHQFSPAIFHHLSNLLWIETPAPKSVVVFRQCYLVQTLREEKFSLKPSLSVSLGCHARQMHFFAANQLAIQLGWKYLLWEATLLAEGSK